jgi:hypothetical protein
MENKPCMRAMALFAIALLTLALPACSASSQGLSSRNFDTPGAKPSIDTAPTLNLDLSVEAAYATIPHKRTVMDFAVSNMAEQDKRFLEVAFHLIDQAIRLRVTAYQKFSRGEVSDSPIAEFDRLIEYLRKIEAPSRLSDYQARLLQALSDQRAFFQEWVGQGQQFQYGRSVATHPKVQSASSALRAAYGILMELYPNETSTNKEAFFDYHCALDFI